MQQELAVWESEVALKVLQEMDEERVASCLSSTADTPETEIGISTITAMFEALSFHRLLDDTEVNKALESALLGLSQHHDLALADGGRYPGLYRLLAHDNQKLRLLVCPTTSISAMPQLCATLKIVCLHIMQDVNRTHYSRWFAVLTCCKAFKKAKPFD